MIEMTRRTRELQTSRCPVCKQAVPGDTATLAKHVGQEHAKPHMKMGEIVWTNPPHEAVFMGKLYKKN